MRKNLIRNSLIWILSAIAFIAISCFTLFTVGNPLSVRASSAWQTGVFEMESGTALKIGQEMQNGGGMRFVVKMDASVYSALCGDASAEFGVIIAPKNLMIAANGDYLNMPKKIGGSIDKARLYQVEEDPDHYYANACITNVKANNLKRDFVAIAYIKNESDFRYTEYNDNARNNLYDLVNMALLDEDDAQAVIDSTVADGSSAYIQMGPGEGWFGSKDFPIVVESDDELTFVESLANINDLSNCHVVLKDTVNKTPDFADDAIANKPVSESVFALNQLIQSLPNSVDMPDGIGVVAKIREAEKLYNALSDDNKIEVENYAKVESLLPQIKGYDRVYKHDADDGTVIPSYVPVGFSSTIGGTATTYQDGVYGNVLKVTSDDGGKAALNITNFPDVSGYTKIYFYVRGIGVKESDSAPGANVYWSDGITNDGWGANWKNNWDSAFWTNEATFRLVELNVADGYIGEDFALGFRTPNDGFTFEITDFFGYKEGVVEADIAFGTKVDAQETHAEYGKIYNISREQWYIDNNNTNTIGTLQTNKLANALPEGMEYFYFWMYNGTGSAYNFHLAGDVSGTWTDSEDSFTMNPGEWTKITINAEDIALNKNGQWYVYILGGDGQGATKSGWKISTIYAGPVAEQGYSDHADVKGVISLINKLPNTVTLADKLAVESARSAYDALNDNQKEQIGNYAKLVSAETAIDDIESANEVIELIDAIDSRNIDATLVSKARSAYNSLSDGAKERVHNLSALEKYEAVIAEQNSVIQAVNNVNTIIANLPDSVVMPDHLVFVSRIEEAKEAYDALSDEGKNQIENYAKLRSLLSSIKGYTTVYRQSVDGVNVVPSHVPNYTSTIGGTATMGYDGYYGNYLKVTPNSGGKVAIQFKNFPNVSNYTKIYFNIRVVGASCDIYLSDGITNDGWGDDWNNTWNSGTWTTVPVTWANNGNWIQKEFDLTATWDNGSKRVKNIFASNLALGLRTNTTGVSFEITDIVCFAPDLGMDTGLTFGNFSDSATTNAYGKVYNFTQGWSSDADMGAFNQNALKNALASGHDSLRFWIYNPNSSDVDFKFSGDMNEWNPSGDYVTKLTAKAWTEVVINSDIIEDGTKGTWFVGVTTGAGTSGWQISPIYSYNSQATSDDAIAKVQNRINALDTNNPNEESVAIARAEFEKLSEAEKGLINSYNLIACETKLYGDAENVPFVTDGQTNYKIYYEGGFKSYATFMQEQLGVATNATLPLVSATPQKFSKYRYAIVLGYNELAEENGVTVPANGYAIKKVGRVVFIVANSQDNFRMGAIAFLREVIGYEMISEDCVIYGNAGNYLPELDLIEEAPSFEVRQQQTYMTKDEVLGMGLQAHTDLWIPSSEGMDMHNTLHYLPTATYRSAHPSWYYTYTDSTNVERTQICPTAGGSSSEFNAMVEIIAENMMVQINAYPTIENISFSIMDTADADDCTCARCKLYDTVYGEGGFAAAWIDLMNAINAEIRPQLNGRKLNIAFLAYRGTEKAPADGNLNGVTLKKRYEFKDNGTYTQTNEDLRCDEGVTVWLAPINAKFAENFNHKDNQEHLLTVEKWCAISDSVYVWLYGTNFINYMYPYNSWQASAENYKILKELGVDGVWSQSNETEATAFTDLKAYIDSKFTFNVDAVYENVLNTYFTNYFGPASTQMREMFNRIVKRCDEIEDEYDGLGRGIYDELENKSGFLGIGAKTYWAKDWVNGLVTLCNEAKDAVDKSALSDAQKTAIKSRITKESLFPRYLLCTTFAGTDKKTVRQEFKADADALGFTLYKEHGDISSLYSGWGVQ